MKHRLFLALISTVIIYLNACSFQNSKDKQKQDDSLSELTVLNWTYNSIDSTIDEFSNLYPNIKLEQKMYDDEDTGGVKEKAITEIMSGEGPDILLLRVPTFPNIHKMIGNNIFYDLDTLIKSDKSFKIEEYNQIVMDSGMYKGKRYLVPLYFSLPVMITTKSFLSDHDFSIPDGEITWTELSQMSKEFGNDGKNKGKYMFSEDSSFENLIRCSYMEYVDYSKRKSSFDSTKFISLLNNYKELQSVVCPAEIAKKANMIELLKNETFGIANNSIALSYISSMNSCFKQYLGEEMYIIPFPTDQPQIGITANIRIVAGINANCKNPREAFEFLKLILSKENQTPYLNLNNSRYIGGLPVNIEAWEEELRHYMSSEVIAGAGESYWIGSLEYKPSPLSPNIEIKVKQLYNNMAKAEINDYRVYTIITEETKAFLADKSSAEKTAKAINQKVMLYLNE